MKRIFTPIVAFLFSSSLYAQEINTTELDRLLDSLNARNKSMASVLLTHQGKTVYERAIGFAVLDGDKQVKATPATRYRIGSVTKTFTATMIMQLVEAGKLALDTHLDQFFPKIPNASGITIEMMLRHRSGIHNFTDDDTYWQSHTQPKTRAEMLANFYALKPDFAPNAENRYSNTNYVLLGYILEDITKQSYAANLQESIVTPLGLKNTAFGGKIDPGRGDAFSYTFSDKWDKQAETDLSLPAGAGAIVSTPADVLRFMQALFEGQLVSKASLEKMTNLSDRVGLGLALTPFYDRKGYGHTGGLDGFQTTVAYFPGDSVGAAVFSNGVNYPLNDILIAMLSTYYQKPFAGFRIMEVSPAVLDGYAGTYASEQIPLKLTIWRKDKTLYAQATGQSAFWLTPVGKDLFKFDAADITIVFHPETHSLTLIQRGQEYQFKK